MRSILSLMVFFALTPAEARPQRSRAPQWPTKGWSTATPAEEGIDPEVLKAIDEEIASGKHRLVDSMLVIRRGRVVFERHYRHDYAKLAKGRDPTPHQYDYDHPDWHPFYKGSKLHRLQSVTKSVTSALIGIAIKRGEIVGTDVRAMPAVKP